MLYNFQGKMRLYFHTTSKKFSLPQRDRLVTPGRIIIIRYIKTLTENGSGYEKYN